MGFQSKSVSEEVIKVREVTVSFGGFKALNELNFSIQPGELRVVIGPNGAGKTTLLDVITGKVRPTSGKVLFRGRDLTRLPEQQIACLGIGRKFQTPNIFKSLTVLENLNLALKDRRNVLSTLPFISRNGTGERTNEILETIGLTAKSSAPAGILAHGEKQWLEL